MVTIPLHQENLVERTEEKPTKSVVAPTPKLSPQEFLTSQANPYSASGSSLVIDQVFSYQFLALIASDPSKL